MSDKPWETEGDYFEIDHLGYKGYVLRQPVLGMLNGYVVIDNTHPYYGKTMYSNEVNNLAAYWGVTFTENILNFHGKTGSKLALVKPEDNKWVFGFDTGHCDDLVPGLDALNIISAAKFGQTYKDKNFVEGFVKILIVQLKEIADAFNQLHDLAKDNSVHVDD